MSWPRSVSMCALRDGVSDTTRSSIFSRSSSGMPSVGNAPWRRSTSGSSPLRFPSWPGRERDRLPARSTLSRFLAALTEAPVEALRTLFLDYLREDPTLGHLPRLERRANRGASGSSGKHVDGL